MNSRQLEYVVTVAEEGSISKAAKKLIISQPSLSQYIQKLEQELGTQLFIRSTPLKLTYEGEVYVAYARKVLLEELTVRQQIADIMNDKVGKLVIGAGQFNSTCILPHIIQKFQEQYPHVKVIMKEAIEPTLFELLEKNDCDLIFTTMLPEGNAHNYMIEEMRKEDYLLAVPSLLDPLADSYESRMHQPGMGDFPQVDIQLFKHLPFIFIENKTITLHRILQELCNLAKIKPASVIECANITVVLHLVAAGAGVSIVPSSSVLFNMGNDVHYYGVKQALNNRTLNLIYQKDRYLTKNAKFFIEISKKIL